MSSGDRPWLTIVTVVRNDPDGLRRTLRSLAPADLGGVQVLVVDGSDDQSLTVSISEASGVRNANVVWDPPRGIYRAMNVGLRLSGGSFTYFLNAGDMLHSAESMDRLRATLARHSDVVWLVARVNFIDERGRGTAPPLVDYSRAKRESFAGGTFPPHQGTVCRTEVAIRLGGFDESYTITADYALMLRLAQESDPIFLDAVLADFESGGVSSTEWRRSLAEFHRARKQVLGLSGAAGVWESLRTLRQFAALATYRWVVKPSRDVLLPSRPFH